MEKYQVSAIDPNVCKDAKASHIIKATEDVYVINGDDENGPDSLRNKNFGDADNLQLKGDSKNGKLYRRIFLKFDISAISGEPIKKVLLKLYGTKCQDITASAAVYVREADAYAWKQNEITFNNAPASGDLIAEAALSRGVGLVDVTEYVLKMLSEGKKIISFVLEGDDSNPLHVQFSSTRNENGFGPTLVASYTERGFITNIAANEDVSTVWKRAAQMVDEWSNDWFDVLSRGDSRAELVNEKEEEYPNDVDVTRTPKRPYEVKKTRFMKNIKGYEPVKDGEIKLDEYGGYICDKKFEATGWFHVEEKDGRLWTVTPAGNPFFRLAMVSLSPGGEGRQHTAVMAKCGSLENWAKQETKHLRDDLGFNSLGGWSSLDALSKVEKPMVLSAIVNFVSGYARVHGMNNSTGGSTTFVGGVMPVFDPTFEQYSDQRAQTVVTPYADNKNIYGWMSDNELHSELKMLDSYLSADTTNPWFAYSYATAWTFLRTVTGKEDVDVTDVTDEHRKLFRAMVYNRYFRVVSSAIRKYAPNHMFMGSRFLPGCYRDEYVNRIAGKWCDVISLNYYGAWAPESELMQNIQKWSGTPFIITEWYAKGMDVQKKEPRLTNESGAGFTVRTQKDRGAFYHNYTLKLMECKGCAGFDWFKMWDNDPDNLKTDLSNRNSNKGIYDNDYVEYTELTDEMKLVNKNCYKLIEFFDNDKTRSI